PDIKEWADSVALNPARVPPGEAVDDDLAAAAERFRAAVGPGIAAMAELAGPGFPDGGPPPVSTTRSTAGRA
ncbi:MAG: hypothetical protein WB462_15425, partial [Solirubrobacterales bacterium]